MKDTVTLKELIAILVRRGKLVLLVMVAFAVVLVGMKFTTIVGSEANTPEEIEAQYQQSLKEYQESKEDLERRLENENRRLKYQAEYNRDSLYMKLNPYDEVVSTINFAIVNVQDNSTVQFFWDDNSVNDSYTAKIQNQYKLLFDNLDYQKILNSEYESKYIGEIVSLKIENGGVMTLCVYGTKEEETKVVADTLYRYLESSMPLISGNTYPHELSLLNSNTARIVEQYVADTQQQHLNDELVYLENVKNLEQQLNDLKEPSKKGEVATTGTTVKNVVKYAVLGSAIGCVVAIILVMGIYIFRDRVEISSHLSKRMSIPLLGVIGTGRGIFNYWADRILGERVWKTKEQAFDYLKESIRTFVAPNYSIALVSTLKLTDYEVRPLIEELELQGHKTQFLSDSSHNAAVMTALQNSDCAILLEQCGASKWEEIEETMRLAEKIGTPIGGFVRVIT